MGNFKNKIYIQNLDLMKAFLFALLIASTQAIAIKEQGLEQISSDPGVPSATNPGDEPWKQTPGAYWPDDHRAIIQASREDPRWTTWTPSMKGEDTTKGFQTPRGISGTLNKIHF